MILKIERCREDQQWWILDNIAKVSISYTKAMKEKELRTFIEDKNHDIVLMDNFDNGRTSSYATSDYLFKFKILICRKADGEEFSVMFDTRAYICNDTGQTVEKVVV